MPEKYMHSKDTVDLVFFLVLASLMNSSEDSEIA